MNYRLSRDYLDYVPQNWISIATPGSSWNFSFAKILASLSLKDGPQSGITRLIYYDVTAN